MVTLYPLFFKRRPKEAAVIPFPNDETTPPVTKIYFVMCPPFTYVSAQKCLRCLVRERVHIERQ